MTAPWAADGPWPTGATRLVGVIGDPVRHSLSPVLHNAAFGALGLDWVSVALPVVPGRLVAAVAGLAALGVEGVSVTMPHKTAVVGLCDRVTPRVRLLAAANTIVCRKEELVGESTDGPGLLDALRLEVDPPFDPAGRRCLVVGAGGAARAVILALAEAGAAEVVVVNRSRERAEAAVALAGAAGRVGSAEEADRADLVVNATPLGMDRPGSLGQSADAGGLPVPAERLGPGQLVVDLVYHPVVTSLLAVAQARGARTAGGLAALVHQAALALALWTGLEPPMDAMRKAVKLLPGGNAPE